MIARLIARLRRPRFCAHCDLRIEYCQDWTTCAVCSHKALDAVCECCYWGIKQREYYHAIAAAANSTETP